MKKIQVRLIGASDLVDRGYLDGKLEVFVPFESMRVDHLKLLAEEKGVYNRESDNKLKRADIVKRLKNDYATHGDAPLYQLRVAALSRVPAVRCAVHRYLDDFYRKMGRDFKAAFSYPEYVEMHDGNRYPLSLVWDHGHALKNMRMASANAIKRASAAAG